MRIKPFAALASLLLAGAAVAQPAKPAKHVTPASRSAKVDSTKLASAKTDSTHKVRKHARTRAKHPADSAKHATAKKG